MDGWFRPLLKPGQVVMKSLMRFSLLSDEVLDGGYLIKI
jgi:hypothetical protein